MPVRTLDWSVFGADGIDIPSGTIVDTGGVAVQFDFTAEDEGAGARPLEFAQFVAPGEPFDPTEGLKLVGQGGEGGVDDTSTTLLTFSSTDADFGDAVADVSFRINDLDTGQQGADYTDIVEIRAFDPEGNEIPVVLTPGADLLVSGQTATGNDVDSPAVTPPTDPDTSLLVQIAGPVGSIKIDYDNGGTDAQTAWVTDIEFSTTPTVDDNGDPDAADDSASTPDAGGVVVVPVLANDSDPNGDPLTIDSATDGTSGTTMINPDGTITYTPTDPEFVGTDSFTYTVDDGNGGTDTATVSVTVGTTPPPPPPPAGGPDGFVDGDDSGNLIDNFYTGDPNGDLIDSNDQILPGEGVNDDIVRAGAGDDSVFSGNGDDDIRAGDGDDSVVAGFGDDSVIGEDGDDTVLAGDGNDTVLGGDGDDVIETDNPTPDALDAVTFEGVPVDPFPNDDRDFVDGGAGNDTITNTGDDADTVFGGTGDDVIDTGIDDDVIDGGEGDDDIQASQGSDSVDGGAGDDTIIAGDDLFSDYVGDDPNLPDPALIDPATGEPALSDPNTEDNRDTVDGGDGNDIIQTGDDADEVLGGAGNDTIDAGIDDDTVLGGAGDDSIVAGHGSDSVVGGDGADFIDTSNTVLVLPDEGFDDPTVVPVDTVPENDLDFVSGDMGDDTILTGDDDDTIFAGSGDDVVDGGIDDDEIAGASGDDSLVGGEGDDLITGDLGNDTIIGDTGIYGDEIPNDGTDPEPTNNEDTLFGGDGDDLILGGDDNDVLDGGLGDDTVDGGIDDDLITGLAGDDSLIGGDGDDTVRGGNGDDTILGGDGTDLLEGGQDRDVFRDVGAGDTIDGATTGDDFDTLNLNGVGDFEFTTRTVDADGDSTSGVINILNADGSSGGTITFTEIENIIPCFTPGTVIATPRGERRVEDLQVGDRIITRDNGLQEIRWVGQRTLTGQELALEPNLKPVLIRAGSLGHGLPERDLLVSPQHRILMNSDRAALYFEEREVLAAAKHLTDLEGVDIVESSSTTYIHFMCDQHEVVLSNGSWTESFQPGEQVMDGMGIEQRDEIYTLFPELREKEGLASYQAARRSLKKHEAKLLAAK